jgi:hypothetical protein
MPFRSAGCLLAPKIGDSRKPVGCDGLTEFVSVRRNFKPAGHIDRMPVRREAVIAVIVPRAVVLGDECPTLVSLERDSPHALAESHLQPSNRLTQI